MHSITLIFLQWCVFAMMCSCILCKDCQWSLLSSCKYIYNSIMIMQLIACAFANSCFDIFTACNFIPFWIVFDLSINIEPTIQNQFLFKQILDNDVVQAENDEIVFRFWNLNLLLRLSYTNLTTDVYSQLWIHALPVKGQVSSRAKHTTWIQTLKWHNKHL